MRLPGLPYLAAGAVVCLFAVAAVVSKTGGDGVSGEGTKTAAFLEQLDSQEAAIEKRWRTASKAVRPLPPVKKRPKSDSSPQRTQAQSDPQNEPTGDLDPAPAPTPPTATRSASPPQDELLSPSEVDEASRDATALQMTCLAMLRGKWREAHSWIEKGSGGGALKYAVRTDPDTVYEMPDGSESSFRRVALTVARTIDSPDCLPDVAQDLLDEIYLADYE